MCTGRSSEYENISCLQLWSHVYHGGDDVVLHVEVETTRVEARATREDVLSHPGLDTGTDSGASSYLGHRCWDKHIICSGTCLGADGVIQRSNVLLDISGYCGAVTV